MRKSIIFVLLIIVLYSLVTLLSSCNKDENPVKPIDPPPPPIGPDTVSRYKWTVQQTYLSLFNLYAADTNEVYVVMNNSLVVFRGTNFYSIINNQNTLVKNVYGYDKNNIIATGFSYKDGNYLPCVYKLTNGNIQTFIYENECNITLDLLVTGPNQAWLSSFCESKVYYFDNGTLNIYRLSENDTINNGIFYIDQNKNVFVFAHKFPTAPNDTLFTYKFNGNGFELFRTDCINYSSPDGKNPKLSRCGRDLVMLPYSTLQNLYYFSGYDWVYHSSPSDSVRPKKVGGLNRDTLIALCMPLNNLCIYSGGKWRRENDSPYFKGGVDVSSNVEVKFGNVYLTSCDYFNLLGWFLVGKPNKNINAIQQ
jgi:hypothetical protein